MGIDWTVRYPHFRGLTGLAYGGGRFMAVGYGICFSGCAEPTLLSSNDGTNWVDHRAVTGYLNLWGVTYGNGSFVAVGDFDTILQSDPIAPRFMPVGWSGNRPFVLNLLGDPGQRYRIDASTDFGTWTTLTNLVSATCTNQFTDPTAPNFNHRFYRAVEQ